MLLVIALNVIGILAIGSAKQSVQSKQIPAWQSGIVMLVIASLIDYSQTVEAGYGSDIFFVL